MMTRDLRHAVIVGIDSNDQVSIQLGQGVIPGVDCNPMYADRAVGDLCWVEIESNLVRVLDKVRPGEPLPWSIEASMSLHGRVRDLEARVKRLETSDD